MLYWVQCRENRDDAGDSKLVRGTGLTNGKVIESIHSAACGAHEGRGSGRVMLRTLL